MRRPGKARLFRCFAQEYRHRSKLSDKNARADGLQEEEIVGVFSQLVFLGGNLCVQLKVCHPGGSVQDHIAMALTSVTSYKTTEATRFFIICLWLLG